MVRKSLAMAASAIACGFVLMASTPAAAQQNCRGMVYGNPAEGPIFQRLVVEPRARRSWAQKVRARYGAGYSIWANARQKNIDCKKIAPGRRWVCTARGIPCRG
jgi:hypothetical protein